MLGTIAKVLKILNSDANPSQISLALCLAMVAGFTPLFSLHNLLILFLVLIIRVNLSSFILGLAFFSGLSFLLDPLFHAVGLGLLKAEFLRGPWTGLYNIILFRLSYFYNSIVMGSLVVSLAFFVPMFFACNFLIRKYRDHVLAWVLKLKIVQAIKASTFYHFYQLATSWGGES